VNLPELRHVQLRDRRPRDDLDVGGRALMSGGADRLDAQLVRAGGQGQAQPVRARMQLGLVERAAIPEARGADARLLRREGVDVS
jgi:hypothetical protein